MACIECKDSSQPPQRDSLEHPDCVVANLPWGVNSIDYVDENYRILESIQARISPGTPCTFVTRTADSGLFSKAGFEILAQAHIPPRDFQLPSSKKKKRRGDAGSCNGRKRCVVTIAVSR